MNNVPPGKGAKGITKSNASPYVKNPPSVSYDLGRIPFSHSVFGSVFLIQLLFRKSGI